MATRSRGQKQNTTEVSWRRKLTELVLASAAGLTLGIGGSSAIDQENHFEGAYSLAQAALSGEFAQEEPFEVPEVEGPNGWHFPGFEESDFGVTNTDEGQIRVRSGDMVYFVKVKEGEEVSYEVDVLKRIEDNSGIKQKGDLNRGQKTETKLDLMELIAFAKNQEVDISLINDNTDPEIPPEPKEDLLKRKEEYARAVLSEAVLKDELGKLEKLLNITIRQTTNLDDGDKEDKLPEAIEVEINKGTDSSNYNFRGEFEVQEAGDILPGKYIFELETVLTGEEVLTTNYRVTRVTQAVPLDSEREGDERLKPEDKTEVIYDFNPSKMEDFVTGITAGTGADITNFPDIKDFNDLGRTLIDAYETDYTARANEALTSLVENVEAADITKRNGRNLIDVVIKTKDGYKANMRVDLTKGEPESIAITDEEGLHYEAHVEVAPLLGAVRDHFWKSEVERIGEKLRTSRAPYNPGE